MSTISAQLRNFKEPDRDEQSLLFFAIPPRHVKGHGVSQNDTGDGLHKMEINAVLSLAIEGTEDSYVRTTQLCPFDRVMPMEESRPGSYISSLPISRLSASTKSPSGSRSHYARYEG